MEIISFSIAIAGFLMSLSNWLYTFWVKRKRLKITFDFDNRLANYSFTQHFKYLTLPIILENRSSNPISITQLLIYNHDNIIYKAELEKNMVAHAFKKLIDTNSDYYERFIESASFPIDINGYGARLEYINFTLPLDFDHEKIRSIEVKTNRGSITIDNPETICKLKEFFQKEIELQCEKPLHLSFPVESLTQY